jgi:hypothetical protein
LARLADRVETPEVALGHQHHHHYDDLPGRELDAPTARRLLGGVVAVLVVAALVGIAVWWPHGDPVVDREALGYGDRVDATVTAAEIGPCSFDPEAECNSVTARIAEGPDEGTSASLEADVATRTAVAELDVGDDIVLNDAGPEVDAADGLGYGLEHLRINNVDANTANGNAVTEQVTTVFKDLRVTDNGDGTVTILVLATGNTVVRGPDGKAIARNPGQIRSRGWSTTSGRRATPQATGF